MKVRPRTALDVSYAPKYKAEEGIAPNMAVVNPTYTVRCCIKCRNASTTDAICWGGGGGIVLVSVTAVVDAVVV